jgi:hypothetical protein
MKRRHLAVLALSVLGSTTLAPPLHAGVPSASTSSVDPCVVGVYDGSRILNVLVRDFAGNRIANAYVTVSFAECPAALFCTPPCASCIYSASARTVTMLTGQSGVARFNLMMSGVCAGGSVRISADGVLLATRALATADQDGSGMVDPADQATVHGKIGAADPTADFDCSGTVDSTDEAWVQARMWTSCDVPVPATSSSWGSLKILYR